jgi:DNA-binding HxlR family transcriptional regulator
MPARDEYCPLYRSLDVFGDRWGLLVVRELLRGVSRFNELERSLPGISRSTLAQRLRHTWRRRRSSSAAPTGTGEGSSTT